MFTLKINSFIILVMGNTVKELEIVDSTTKNTCHKSSDLYSVSKLLFLIIQGHQLLFKLQIE